MVPVRRPTIVDLYCGAGGLSLGFEQAGFDVAVGIDGDPKHAATYQQNFPSTKVITADIGELSAEEILEQAPSARGATVVVGGPPCQGFSLIGKRDANDPRIRSLGHFARLVGELAPSYFVLENVPGLLLPEFDGIRRAFAESMVDAGYRFVEPVEVLRAEEFGVPQRRRRVFILGYREGLRAPTYPKPLGIAAPTVSEAIDDLPEVDRREELVEADRYEGVLGEPSGYAAILRGVSKDPCDRSAPREWNGVLTGCLRTSHAKRVRDRFGATSPGSREPISRFDRLAADRTAVTIRAGTSRGEGKHTAPRPIHHESPRCITVREAARLQSFPDWFQFHPTKWHGFRQVGNAVPPLLARAVALRVLSSLG